MISFVIAAYNEEKNIVRCIEPILKTGEKFEVVIVDDGSKDRTLEIAKKISQEDPRVKVVHQENSGVSVARNTGLEQVTGSWVAFADADDIICSSYLSAFSSYIETEKYDILQALQYKNNPYPEDDEFYEFPAQYLQLVALNRQHYINSNDSKFAGILESVHGAFSKLFSVSFLKRNNLCFKEGMGLGEDLLFYIEALERTEKVVCINKNIYRITENMNSSTRRFNKKMIDYTYIFNQAIYDFYEKNSKGEEFYADMCAQILVHVEVGITQTILKSKKWPEWREIDSYYSRIFDDERIYKAIRCTCIKMRPPIIKAKQRILWIPIWLLANKKPQLYLFFRFLERKYIQHKIESQQEALIYENKKIGH